MTGQLELSIVRIRTTNGKVFGAGFLVSGRHVLTCAHVVARALGLPDDPPETPAGKINLDFPLIAPGQLLTASVILWYADEDIAGLQLDVDPPNDARPVRSVHTTSLWGHRFRAFGFPDDYKEGVWVSGVLRAQNAAGWIQIEDVKQPGFRVQPGFSGTPVWDEEWQGVVGMTVAAEAKSDIKAAFIIPAVKLVAAWPDLVRQMTSSHSPRHISKNNRFSYCCFISYHHGQRRLTERIINDLHDALSSELELLCSEELYLDRTRLLAEFSYDEDLAEKLCRSVCMIIVFTPTYFDQQHSYCAREYKAMERLERSRLRLMGRGLNKSNSLIIPIVFRGGNCLPTEIRERRQWYNFEDFLLCDVEMYKHPGYAPKIKEIAEYIAGCCRMLSSLPQPLDECKTFALPTDEEIRQWLGDATRIGIPFPRR